MKKTKSKKNMKLQHNYSGASLLELKDKFGLGNGGFYDNTWWLKEEFAKDQAAKGIYEIDFEKKLTNLTYEEQKEKLPNGFDFPHPAVIVEAALEHYKKTGEYLLKDWYTRTSLVGSDERHVYVGRCDPEGVFVYYCWDGLRVGRLGVSAARKFDSNLESRTLAHSESLSPFESQVLSELQEIKKLLTPKGRTPTSKS